MRHPSGPPSRWWYLPAVGVPVLAVFAVMFSAMSGLLGSVADAPRFAVPGELDIQLSSGDYLIYGEPLDSMSPHDTKCEVRAPDGEGIPVHENSSAMYQYGSSSGRSLFGFHCASEGTYRVSCAMSADRTGRVAIKSSAIGGLLVATIVMVSVMFIGIAFAFAVFLKRRKAGAPFP
jgi:hypothetical protein